MRLFFDTETSGMVDFRSGPGENQPVPVQAAFYLETLSGNVVRVASFLIDPGSWGSRVPWDPDAERVHGIPREVASSYGIPAQEFANTVRWLVGLSTVTIAHNVEFDLRVVNYAMARLNLPRIEWPASYCTMLRSVQHVRKPVRRSGEFGWPKLGEAYRHFVGKELSGAHDALVDVYACRAVYRGIVAAEQVPVADAPLSQEPSTG